MTLPQPRAPAPQTLTETKRTVPWSPREALHTADPGRPSPGWGRPVCYQTPSLCFIPNTKAPGPLLVNIRVSPSSGWTVSTHLQTWFLGCRLHSQHSPTRRGTPIWATKMATPGAHSHPSRAHALPGLGMTLQPLLLARGQPPSVPRPTVSVLPSSPPSPASPKLTHSVSLPRAGQENPLGP